LYTGISKIQIPTDERITTLIMSSTEIQKIATEETKLKTNDTKEDVKPRLGYSTYLVSE